MDGAKQAISVATTLKSAKKDKKKNETGKESLKEPVLGQKVTPGSANAFDALDEDRDDEVDGK